MEYLFVYGTLLNDIKNRMSQFLKENAELVGEGYFHGKLYNVSWYPAAVLSNNQNEKVFGVIYKLNNPEKTLLKLDDYEGIGANHPEPYEYTRTRVKATLHTDKAINCWLYVYNLEIKHLKIIPSGKFLSVRND